MHLLNSFTLIVLSISASGFCRGFDFGDQTATLALSGNGKLNVSTQLTNSGGTINHASAAASIQTSGSAVVQITDGVYEDRDSTARIGAGKLVLSSTGVSNATYFFSGTTVTLDRDYYIDMDQVIEFGSDVASVVGNGHTIEFNPRGVNSLVVDGTAFFYSTAFKGLNSASSSNYSNIYFSNDSTIILTQDLNLTVPWNIASTMALTHPIRIIGNGNSLIFGQGGSMQTFNDALCASYNVNYRDVQTGALQNDQTASTLQFYDCTFNLSGDWTDIHGAVTIFGTVVVNGPYKFINNGYLLSIEANSELLINDGCTYYYDASPYNIQIGGNSASALHFNNAHFYATNNYPAIMGSNLRFSGYCTMGSDAIDLSTAIQLGSWYQPLASISLDAGATLDFTNGQLTAQNFANFAFNGLGSTLRFSGNSVFNLSEAPINIANNGMGSFQLRDAATINPLGGYLTLNATGGGYFDTGDATYFDGTYVMSSDSMTNFNLAGGGILRGTSLTKVDRLLISGAHNRLEGYIAVNDDIYYADQNTTATLSLSSPLANNIYLNGGMALLEDAVEFCEGAFFIGGGTVNVNGRRLLLGGTTASALTCTNDYCLQNAGDMVLNGKTALSGAWYFDSDAVINGMGNILDLSLGGTLAVGPGVTLSLVNVNLKGLGTDGPNTTFGKIVTYSGDSQIRMSHCTVELASDVTTTIGGVYVEGPTTWLLGNHNWTFDCLGTLTVDGTTLGIDKESTVSTTAGLILFNPSNGGAQAYRYITYLNNGFIRDLDLSIENSYAATDIINTQYGTVAYTTTSTTVNTVWTLDRDYYFSNDRLMTLSNGDAAAINVIINGNGHTISCVPQSYNLFNPDPNIAIVFENVLYKGYDNGQVALNGNLVAFGDNSIVTLDHDITLSNQWAFSSLGNGGFGDAGPASIHIYGNGNTVSFADGGSVYIDEGISVAFHNVVLDGVSTNNFSCALSDRSQVAFHNSTIKLAQDFTLNNPMIIQGDVTISGSTNFNYSSALSSTIDSRSRLILDKNLMFNYQPASANNVGFYMTDSSSILRLNGCTLNSTTTGLHLSQGTLQISGKTTIVSQASVLAEAIVFGTGTVGQDLMLDFDAGGMLDIAQGFIDYANTEQ